MRRIVIVVTGLEVGGAETMLVKLLSGIDRSRFDPIVVALRGGGPLKEQIQRLGIEVIELGISRLATLPSAYLELRRLAKQLKPQVIQGWMYHGNLAALTMHRSLRSESRLLWSVRVTADSRAFEKPLTRAIVQLGARYSKRPASIIYNSTRSLAQHALLGYKPASSVVIPNGFDTDIFKPSESSRRKARLGLGITDKAPVIGIVGRYHPIKDHATFIDSAALICKELPDTRILFVGRGMDESNKEVVRKICELGLDDHCYLLGNRQNLQHLYPAMDLHVSSSVSEGFPNVLGEAMSCGVPCVATDVGDSALVLGDTGLVVPKGDANQLAQAVVNMLQISSNAWCDQSERARSRIVEHFSIGSIVSEYEAIFDGDLSTERSRSATWSAA